MSSLRYNYFRTYDPSTGRYLESDPIGLAGGPNTYLYASASPVNRIDPLGLQDTVTTRILALAARGDTAGLRSLTGSQGLTPAQQALARRAILNLENGVHGAKSTSELAKHIKNLERY